MSFWQGFAIAYPVALALALLFVKGGMGNPKTAKKGSPAKAGGTGIRARAAALTARRDQLEGTPPVTRNRAADDGPAA